MHGTMSLKKMRKWCIQKRRNKLWLLQFITINWLINSIEHSLFCVGSGSFASQDSPRIVWNPESFYRVHKCKPFAPTLRQLKAFHQLHPISLSVFEYYLLIYVYIFTLFSFLQVFFHQNPVAFLLFPMRVTGLIPCEVYEPYGSS